MMAAPERIYLTHEEEGPMWEDTYRMFRCSDIRAHPDLREYHLAREGQPCSDREFMEMVSRSWEAESSEMGDYHAGSRISAWIKGDFTAAMEGLT